MNRVRIRRRRYPFSRILKRLIVDSGFKTSTIRTALQKVLDDEAFWESLKKFKAAELRCRRLHRIVEGR